MDSSLISAVWNGHESIVKLLLAAEPQLLILPMADGSVPLHVAVGTGNIGLRDGSNALHIAVASDKPNLLMVKRLIELGCSLEARERFGCSPLHRACMMKNLDIVRIFLKAGASPHITDNDGLTPMHSLCSATKATKHIEDQCVVTILKEFLEHGADITMADRVGSTILHYAVSRTTNIPLIQFILKAKPELAFTVDKSERVPLHITCTMYKNKTIQSILEQHMSELDPEFLKTFNPTHRVEYQKNVIQCNLEEGEKFAVLNGDVSLEGIAKKIRNGTIKNIIVLTGAGISTNAGIPDFRGEKGIYKNKAIEDKVGVPPSNMFSLSTLQSRPDAFYKALKEFFLPVIQGKFSPTACHQFIVLMEKKGLLLRNFTQNIDTLELQAGLSPQKLVEAHGSFARVYCPACGFKSSETTSFWKDIENDTIPMCSKCTSSGKQNPIQPDIVLFGQSLPNSFFDSQTDFKLCDLLIVAGTSLQVYPFASLVNSVNEKCPRLLFNLEAVGAFTNGVKMKIESDGTFTKTDKGLPGTYRDVAVLGDIDKSVSYFRSLIEKEDNASSQQDKENDNSQHDKENDSQNDNSQHEKENDSQHEKENNSQDEKENDFKHEKGNEQINSEHKENETNNSQQEDDFQHDK